MSFTADLATVGLASTRFLFAGAVAVTPVDGLDGILRGEPYALAYFDGTGTTVARGYYRLAIGSDGSALLLTATGATASRGRAGFDLVANPGTPYCEFQPDPGDDDEVCLHCTYGGWAVLSCFTIFF